MSENVKAPAQGAQAAQTQSAQQGAQRPQQRRMGGGPMGGGGMMMGGAKPRNFKASMGKLIKYLAPYLPFIIIATLFIAASSVFTILSPSRLGNLTNVIQKAFFDPVTMRPGNVKLRDIDMAELKDAAFILIIFYAASFILNYSQGFIMAGVNNRVAKNLRTSISKKINKVPLKYFDGHSIGDTLSRVTNDVDTIGQTLNQSFSGLISSVVLLIGVLIAMFITSWQLALTAIVTVPLSVIIMSFIMKASQKYFRNQANFLGELNGQIEENYSGQTVVKAFNGERAAQEAFDGTNGRLAKNAVKSQFISGLMMPIMGAVSNLGYIAICVIGGILFSDGTITLGVITSFFIYLRLFQNPMVNIAQSMNNLQSTAAAAERVFEFLDSPDQPEDLGGTKIENVKGKVEFKNVFFGYDAEKPVIKDFSALIEPGQKVAIVGPTGAGKTTIINLIMRFYEINSGSILIDDAAISDMKREDVRTLFGMVLQDTWLFEGTIRENITYSKQGVSNDEVVRACEAANVDHFIRTLPKGYDMFLDDEVSISSGQRQLLTIARAMVQNSPMLILDEATSNVDTRTEQLIQDAMDKITKGRTSFVIAHRLSTIKNADLILVMKNGEIVEQGNHDALLEAKGFYSELYNSQFDMDSETGD